MSLSSSWTRTRPLYQTHLGSSAQKELAIIDLYKSIINEENEEIFVPRTFKYDTRLSKKNFIFRLPNELLFTVLEATISRIGPRSAEWHCDCEPQYKIADMKALALVCHRFYRAVLPLLYHTIRFNRFPGSAVPPSLAVLKLHRNLQKNPSLCQYCRVFSIYIDEFGNLRGKGKDDFVVANDLVSSLTKVRCLNIVGGFEEIYNSGTWDLIRKAVHHMPEIENFRITGVGLDGLILAPIMIHVDIPSLKKLEIHGLSAAVNDGILPKIKKYRNASFTSLSLSNYRESPQATAQLLQWPIALSHFEIGGFYNNPFYMDLPLLRPMLWIHKDTLKTLKIGHLSQSNAGHLFKVSDFPNLKVLALSRWQMDSNLDSPAADADLLLGTHLMAFGWDFGIYDQHSESWVDFGVKEEHWVREFARAAVAKKAALREITIEFNPDSWALEGTEEYPWDRIDKVCDEMRPYGLLIKYSKPPITKETWLYRVSKVETEEWTNSPSRELVSPVLSSPELDSQDAKSSTLEDLDLDVLDFNHPESVPIVRDIREYFHPV